MKKTLATAGLLVAFAGAAFAGTPTIAPAPVPASCEKEVVELDAIMALAEQNGMPNTYGPRMSYNWYMDGCATFCHQVDVSLATLWGSEDGLHAFLMPMTAGYTANWKVADATTLYAGVNAGIVYSNFEADHDTKADWDFTWGLDAGVKYAICDDTYLKLGYEFGRSYLGYKPYGMPNLTQHSIVIGAGMEF